LWNWALVRCDCLNRTPLPKSDLGDAPHGYHRHHRKHFSGKQRQDIEDWKKNVYLMYECGHRSGSLSEVGSTLYKVGRAVIAAFSNQPESLVIFRRLNDPFGEDERLFLSGPDVRSWQKEIEQIQRFLSGEDIMEWQEMRTFRDGLETYDLSEEEVRNALEQGLALCRASLTTGNPIEFYH
jgi:hypothetical protein